MKQTKMGAKEYVYYRCSRYSTGQHPRVCLTENELDAQIQEMLSSLSNPSNEGREWVQMVVQSILKVRFEEEEVVVSDAKRLLSLLETQWKKLLSKNLSGAITDELYDQQRTEFDERERSLKRQIARHQKMTDQTRVLSEEAGRVFDILATDWTKMERRARQLVLSALFGGFRLKGRTLIPENRTQLELFRAM